MRTCLSLFAAGCLLLTGVFHALSDVDPTDFSRKLELSFDGYNRSTPLTNFPALVVLNTNVEGFSYGDFTSPTGADLRFADGSGTSELPFEIDHWDSAGSSFVWVRIPELSGTNTRITAYWGSTDTTLPAYATNGAVWTEDYVTVWHFDENSRTGPYADSSPSGNTGITSDTLNRDVGVIGNAKYLDNGEYVQTVQDSPVTGAMPRTTSIWIKSGDARGHIAGLGYNDRNYGVLSLCAYNRLFRVWWGGTLVATSTRGVTRNTWLHAAVTYDGTTATLFVDGEEIVSGAVPLDTAPYGAIVGSTDWQTYAGEYRFTADEFRVSTVARSPDWIWAAWQNQSSPTNLVTYGHVRNAMDTLPEIANAPAADISIDSATFAGSVTSTGRAPTQVTLYWGETDETQAKQAWDHALPFGTVGGTPPIALSTNISGLQPETRYYYRFHATNAYGEAWASPATSFATLSRKPTIQNLPATDLNLTTATLRGYLTYTGAAPVTVTVYWGEENGGTDPGAWAKAEFLGTNTLPVPTTLATGITGLSPKQTYYYRFHASNVYGNAWAPSAAAFATSDEVPRILIPSGSVWHYLDNGSDQGTNWAQVGFNANSWSNGPAELGYGDGGEATEISFGGDGQSKHITYYFRHELVLSAADLAMTSSAEVRLRRDDGAIVYLNGKEIFRSNMPTGTVDYLTPAGTATGSEVAFYPQSFTPSLFREGTNVIAVEVHQQSQTSSDVSFDLELGTTIVYPSVGFYPIPSVTGFVQEASYPTLSSPAVNDHSGCALREKSREILIPNRSWSLGIATIQVYGMDGAHHRQIEMPGWDDLEGVRVIDPASDTYAVLEEGNGDITLVTIDDEVTRILKSSGVTYPSGVNGQDNKGLEGVAYDAKRDCFYVVKEKYPLSVFRVSGPPANTTTTPLFDGATVFAGLATDLSDVAYDPGLDHLLILSDEAATVFECKLDGTIVATLPVSGEQPEGVALSADGTELHIVSEPAAYFRYRRDYLSGHSQEGTNVAIRVALTSPWTNAVLVDFSLNDGSAVVGQDVTHLDGATTGTVSIAAGATEAFIPLDIVNDGLPEHAEQFTITLGNARNALLDAGREYLQVIDPFMSSLTVVSPYGTPTPARGTNAFIEGTALDCTISGSPMVHGSTQHVCVGWIGTGSIPASGATVETGPVSVTGNSSIAWVWATNYWLSVSSEESGSISSGSAWHGAGSNAVLTAVPKSHVAFAGWSGDTLTNDTNSLTIALTMDRGLAVAAHFTPELATNATPIWWLVDHYGSSSNFDALAMADTDGDGLLSWQEYRAGTLPTNTLSRLAIVWQQVLSDGHAAIFWDSVSGRSYNLYATTNLPLSRWVHLRQVQGTGNRMSYTATNTWTHPTYYRVTVQP